MQTTEEISSSRPVEVPPLSIPTRLEISIDDDSSEDEQEQIRALEEDQGIYHHEEVVVSPKNESDDDIPLQRFKLSHPTAAAAAEQAKTAEDEMDDVKTEEETKADQEDFADGSGKKPERRRSVRFINPFNEEEDGRNEHFSTPSPDSLRYIKALENPMEAGDLDDLKDMKDNFSDDGLPPGSPPAYASEDEASKKPAVPVVSTGPPPSNNKRQGSLNELFIAKVTQPFHNMIRRASRIEEDSNHSGSDDDDDDDDDDYTEDEIAVLTYIDSFKPQNIELTPVLQPFTIEYIPATGEIEQFVNIPRPDQIDDNIGLTQLNEPPCNQTDAAIVDMQIRIASKEMTDDDSVPVKILERADEKPDQIEKWIKDMKEFHKTKPAQKVYYRNPMPDIETLMQEWPPQIEKLIKEKKFVIPPASLPVSLEDYVKMCLAILDIPVGNSLIESTHHAFALLNEFEASQHFRNLAQNNNLGGETGEHLDRLEL